ncbi:prephenate dehydrogenase/arogenate dehydrogenase family protein [Ignavibacterium sp.]|uniref:prephenate dehydrogenase/arogenate dehydrogenase family protein n=1 Tax=Ignavibacterium sp. TaxID=2651167 RepID=UPI00307CF8D2
MKFNSVGIAGLGLIGGSIAKSLKSNNSELNISAFDYQEVLQKALSQNVIDKALSSYSEILKCELIILALPINASLKLFEDLFPLLNENQCLIDVCSVKSPFAHKERSLKSLGKYVGLHPMAGREKGGFDNSDNLLFENAVCFICDSLPDERTKTVLDFLKPTGLLFTFIDADLHDKITAEVSHLPQLLSVMLVNSTAKTENGFNFINFAGSGFKDMTRIASSDFKIWKEIIENNKANILNALKDFRFALDILSMKIEYNDFEYLKNEFESARKSREEISFNHKGFIQPLFDLTVFLKDEPGSLSRLTTILFENNLNIKDIELLKIREGSGGNFRLYFESTEDVERAKRVLTQNNFATNYTN